MSLIRRVLRWLHYQGFEKDPERQYDDGRFCDDCPDHEACSQGAPCWYVKQVNK